jgi:hypothetical protein
MKTKKYFYSIASLCMVFSFNSCSNYEDDDTQLMERPSVVDLTSEKGQNPDDLILDGEYSHKHAQAYLYTIGNDTGGNRVYIYKQNDNGDIVFQGMVSSGGVGNGMPLESQGAVVVNRKKRLSLCGQSRQQHDFFFCNRCRWRTYLDAYGEH